MGRDEMRAADADRQAVADKLKKALDEGRLDLAEYDERLQQAYAAKTYGDLEGLLDDIPDHHPGTAHGDTRPGRQVRTRGTARQGMARRLRGHLRRRDDHLARDQHRLRPPAVLLARMAPHPDGGRRTQPVAPRLTHPHRQTRHRHRPEHLGVLRARRRSRHDTTPSGRPSPSTTGNDRRPLSAIATTTFSP